MFMVTWVPLATDVKDYHVILPKVLFQKQKPHIDVFYMQMQGQEESL